jgi:hypothetical protein
MIMVVLEVREFSIWSLGTFGCLQLTVRGQESITVAFQKRKDSTMLRQKGFLWSHFS